MGKLFSFCLLLLQIINGSEQDNLIIKSLICQASQKQRFACLPQSPVHLEMI